MSELVTNRLLMRPWREEDLRPFADLNADPRVMRYFPAALSREESDSFAKRIQDRHEQEDFGFWAVERRDSGEFIGMIGLSRPNFSTSFTPCVEVGWRLAAAHWGQGFATEGALAALHFGFTTLELDEIMSFTTLTNQPSRRVMEKLGMRHDPGDDFQHPSLPEGHLLRPHVLYRSRS